ncbi:MAG: AAA family ATPase [Alistipes senegalensis]
MRYQSPQAVFAIPANGWAEFGELIQTPEFPKIVYVPPFSGIEPHEQWMDDGNVKQHIGKSQPGSVLRNLLFRVINTDTPIDQNIGWQEIYTKVKEWFGIELQLPQYTFGVSTEIKAEYKSNGKSFDVISGGSGFHQIITLLAFLHGYSDITTILLDEPDAHLHNNLQKKIVNYFIDKDKQFLIATHSEEFIRNVDMHSIISIMSGKPVAIDSTDKIIKALSEVDNNDVLRTQESPYILYVEGEDDDRILSAWANVIDKDSIYQKFYTYPLGGRSKQLMKECSDDHYTALKQIVPTLKRVVLLDYDNEDTYHPDNNNPGFKEWKRKNIDNYLLVPEAWRRAVAIQLNESEDSLLLNPYYEIINEFFESQNLTLPRNANWRTVNANIFTIIDGKRILFSDQNSLFNQILTASEGRLKMSRQNIALAMQKEEIHQDVYDFFEILSHTTID